MAINEKKFTYILYFNIEIEYEKNYLFGFLL
jgi:hypothetical protein